MKQSKILLLILLLLIMNQHLLSQNEIKSSKDDSSNMSNSTLLLQYNSFGSSYIMQGDKKYKINSYANNTELYPLFNNSVAAKEEFLKFEKQKRLGKILSYLGYSILIADIIWTRTVDINKDRNKYLTMYWIFAGVGFTINLISIPIFNESKNHLNKAIWHYNNMILNL